MSRSYGDRADGADKLRVLKAKLDSAKREILRLRKELNKATQRLNELEVTAKEGQEESRKKKKGDGLSCEECLKGTYEVFPGPLLADGKRKTYLICNQCPHRKVLK